MKLEEGVMKHFTPLIAEWKKNSSRVAIYGAGIHTRFLLSLIDFNDSITCILDGDPKKIGTRFLSWEVHGPEMIKEMGLDAIVISSKHYQEEIYDTIVHYEDMLGLEIVKCYQ